MFELRRTSFSFENTIAVVGSHCFRYGADVTHTFALLLTGEADYSSLGKGGGTL